MITEEANPEVKFQEFFSSFKTESGEYKYRKRLAQMALIESKSLIVDFEDLVSFDSSLAREIVQKPDEFLVYASKSAWAQLKIEDPEYAEQLKTVFVRFRKTLDKTSIRAIGSDLIGTLVTVDGIVVRATPVKPLLTKAAFRCRKCDALIHVEQTGFLMKTVPFCPQCKGKAFDFIEKESTFINHQELRIQEKPEDLPPGQLPRVMDVEVTNDLVDVARPGDRITLTGIVRAKQEASSRGGKLRTFELYLDANFIDTQGRELEDIEITPEEEEEIKKIASSKDVYEKLIKSIAPSIYGYPEIKEAILYLLFSGVRKHLPDGVTIRGDINVLLVGDPGTAKSALLQYVARIAPRGLYTSGRGSTAAGLTAAVIREKSGGMVLEAGALVLADKGVACIDEIDKMKPEDRVAMHEAMEQQTVSVAKGGIVATLNARASVLAAANPALGRYDPYRLITENINLPVTILSRFDLIFVMKDEPNPEIDDKMSTHILSLHQKRESPESAPIPPELLRKYISYAKKIEPKLTDEAVKELKSFYLKMRASSGSSQDSPIAITPRQLEALVRLAEARARAALRTEVKAEDAKAIIRLMNASLQNVGIDVTTGKIDIDVIMTGKPKSLRDTMQIVRAAIAELQDEDGAVEEQKLYKTLIEKFELKEEDVKKAVNQLLKEGLLYTPKPGFLKRTTP